MHHVLESFSTEWLSEKMHTLPLREFLNWSLGLTDHVPAQHARQQSENDHDEQLDCSAEVLSGLLTSYARGGRPPGVIEDLHKALPGHERQQLQPGDAQGGAPISHLRALKEMLEFLIREREAKQTAGPETRQHVEAQFEETETREDEESSSYSLRGEDL